MRVKKYECRGRGAVVLWGVQKINEAIWASRGRGALGLQQMGRV